MHMYRHGTCLGGREKDTDDGDEEKEFEGDREADTTPKRVSSGENEQHSLGVRTKRRGTTRR